MWGERNKGASLLYEWMLSSYVHKFVFAVRKQLKDTTPASKFKVLKSLLLLCSGKLKFVIV